MAISMWYLKQWALISEAKLKDEIEVENRRNHAFDQVIVEIGFVDELDGEMILMGDGEVVCLDQNIALIFKGGEVVYLMSKCLDVVFDNGSNFKLKKFLKKGVSGVKAGYWICGDKSLINFVETAGVITHVLTSLYGQANIHCLEQMQNVSVETKGRLNKFIEVVTSQHGGKEIIKPFEVSCGNNYLGEFKGCIKPGMRENQKKEISFSAIYDGRRYSKRLLFLIGNNNKGIEIFYDQDKFDQCIADLEDHRIKSVSMTVLEEVGNKKLVFHLCEIKPADEQNMLTPLEKMSGLGVTNQ